MVSSLGQSNSNLCICHEVCHLAVADPFLSQPITRLVRNSLHDASSRGCVRDHVRTVMFVLTRSWITGMVV